MFEPLVDMLFDGLFEAGCFREHFLEICLCDDQEGAGLDRLQVKEAGASRAKTFHGGNALALEEELKGDLPPVVIEPEAQTALMDIIGLSGDLSFPQQDRLRGNLYLLEEVLVGVPMGIETGDVLQVHVT